MTRVLRSQFLGGGPVTAAVTIVRSNAARFGWQSRGPLTFAACAPHRVLAKLCSDRLVATCSRARSLGVELALRGAGRQQPSMSRRVQRRLNCHAMRFDPTTP